MKDHRESNEKCLLVFDSLSTEDSLVNEPDWVSREDYYVIGGGGMKDFSLSA